MATGDIGAVVDSLEFDPDYGTHPALLHISGDVYAIAYSGVDSDGWLKTVTIEVDGSIGGAAIDSLEFDANTCEFPELIHLSGNVYAIIYQGYLAHTYVSTVTIEEDGEIGAATIERQEKVEAISYTPDVLHISGILYVLIYDRGTGGRALTISINADGTIPVGWHDYFDFDGTAGVDPTIIHVDGDVYAIPYSGVDDDGWLKTITIEADGSIGGAAIDSLEFDAGACENPAIIHVDGDVFAIAYITGAGEYKVATVTIEADGEIGAAAIDVWTSVNQTAGAPNILHIGEDVYAIVGNDAGTDGWLETITIETDGEIGAVVIDSLEFDAANGGFPYIVHVSGDVYAIAYNGVDADGWIKTVTIETPGVSKVQHLMLTGLG